MNNEILILKCDYDKKDRNVLICTCDNKKRYSINEKLLNNTNPLANLNRLCAEYLTNLHGVKFNIRVRGIN